MNRTTAPLLALLLLLAGCSTGDSATTGLAIDFPEPHPDVQATVDFSDNMTAHAQLLAWALDSGTDVDIREFSFGACLDAIDGLPSPPGCSSGAPGYWALGVNGKPSEVGMDQVYLKANDKVTWTYTPLDASAQPGGASSAPKLTVATPEPTRNATIRLTGSVDKAVRLTVTGADAVEVPAGPWSIEVPVGPGRTPLTVLADDGAATATTAVVAVRLVSATFEAKFTAYPLHPNLSDQVWLDLDAHLSASLYNGTSSTHPSHANVHDLMVAWSAQTGKAIEYGGPGDFGFSVNKIDGIGQPLTAQAPPYWCYKANGSGDVLGITAQELHAGDVITWEYAGCA